jgi:ATP-dependent RNA helicase DDX54/DBP10
MIHNRLFEMGFSVQLHEILYRLPPTRQTLLFSATLPKSLVEFAKAGLQNPKLVRLDADTKISPDLQMGFFSVKPDEKEAALICLLRDVIKVPYALEGANEWRDRDLSGGEDGSEDDKGRRKDRKRKRPVKYPDATAELAPHQTIIFTATKHHVEYLSMILSSAGYACSTIYGSMDQLARRSHLLAFRRGYTSLLVVTDLAARGIDIPILENVVNYDFPVGSRAFIHRVGRTARAGRKGWAYSLVTNMELPYLLDLELFLSRPLKICPLSSSDDAIDFSGNLVMGTLPRASLDLEAEHVRTTLVNSDAAVISQREVAQRAQKMYERSQAKASPESYRRAKEMTKSQGGLAGTLGEDVGIHPVFRTNQVPKSKAATSSAGPSRASLMASVNSFRPSETVFEIGSRGKAVAAQLMRNRRAKMGKMLAKIAKPAEEDALSNVGDGENQPRNEGDFELSPESLEDADEEEIEVRERRLVSHAVTDS